MQMTRDSFLAANSEFETTGPVLLRVRGGHRLFIRTAKRLFGASLSVAALGLWLVPVGAGGTAEILSKVMITLVLAFAGTALWQSGAPTPSPEIEIDMIRREVRLVRYYGQTKSLVTSRRFSDLSGATFSGRDVKLWDQGGALLADLSLPDEALVGSLRRALEESRITPRQAA